MSEAARRGETPSIQPDYYVIRLKECLSPHWSEWFEGLAVTNTPNGETLLAGCIADQSALHGLLARIRDLNLTLISACRVDQETGVLNGKQLPGIVPGERGDPAGAGEAPIEKPADKKPKEREEDSR